MPTPDEVMDLVARRASILLSIVAQKDWGYPDRKWNPELEEIESELVSLGLLKAVGQGEEAIEQEADEAGPSEVVSLRGSNFHRMEAEQTTEGPASRPCSFCGGAGEKAVDMEIDGFIYEIMVDCPH